MEKPLPFALLQTRIGRKNITKKQLQEAPIGFFAYDLLEFKEKTGEIKLLQKEEINWKKLLLRYKSSCYLIISPVINFTTWDELAQHQRKIKQKWVAEGSC